MIDETHLDRQTMGDASLAGELLGMFVTQLDAASRELADATPQRRIALGHSLKGTARSLGIAAVADCAVALEAQTVDPAVFAQLARLVDQLRQDVARRGHGAARGAAGGAARGAG